MDKIEPLFNHILIKPAEKKHLLVSQQKNFCDYGTVIAVGPDVKTIKVDDIIGYTVWGLNHIELNGTKHFLVPEDPRFILGRITLSGVVAS